MSLSLAHISWSADRNSWLPAKGVPNYGRRKPTKPLWRPSGRLQLAKKGLKGQQDASNDLPQAGSRNYCLRCGSWFMHSVSAVSACLPVAWKDMRSPQVLNSSDHMWSFSQSYGSSGHLYRAKLQASMGGANLSLARLASEGAARCLSKYLK